jgi:hypothetical protein
MMTVTTPAKPGTPEHEAARAATARSTLDMLDTHLARWLDDPSRLSQHLRSTHGELVDRVSERVAFRLALLHVAMHGPELLLAQRVVTGANTAGICPRCWHDDCTGVACHSLGERALQRRRELVADAAMRVAESHAAALSCEGRR